MAEPLSALGERYPQLDEATVAYLRLLEQSGPGAAQGAYRPLGNDPWTNTMIDPVADRKAYEAAQQRKLDRVVMPDRGVAYGAMTPQEEAIALPERDQIPKSPIDFGLLATGNPLGRIAALATGASLEASPAEAGRIFRGGYRTPSRAYSREPLPASAFEPNPRATMGGNMPPPEFAMDPYTATATRPPPLAGIPAAIEAAPKTWAEGLPRAQPAKQSTDIPSIREMSVEDAIEVARTQPHLIQAGDRAKGYYVGGPPDVQSKRGLTNRRKRFDDYIAADPRGGDWYDRYRAAVANVTGDVPSFNEWMAAQEGQWSAGVDPGSELHFALKENNASIAGMPVKAARPAQHEAHLRALQTGNWEDYQLGKKTGEYAGLVNPDQAGPPGATGVNDFRHGENWGFPRKQGTAFTDAQHNFLDMETALAVDRANKTNLGGRSNWTGEQLQAAPWVRQKALDIQSRGGKNEDGSFKLTYEEAFERANKTIGDFFPRHTAYATYEAQPGAYTGHMTGSVEADAAARQAFFDDPRSRWATAPGGRDAIYSGLGVEGTGNYMRVRPTQDMQGFYKTEAGIEKNPGEVARPLVTFDTAETKGSPFKEITPHDKAILNAGEAVRALLDAQQAGAWHKNWTGGPANQSSSLFFPRAGKSTPEEMLAMQDKLAPYGLGDVADTGSGITSTSFWPKPEANKAFDKALRKGEFRDFGEPRRVRVDSDIVDYTDEWKQGIGSQAATRKMLEYVNKTPQLRDAFNRNGDIAERALARMSRDKDWAAQWGAPRQDIQNLREIIGEGPGWIDRIEDAVRRGAILPAVATAILGAAMAAPGSKGSEGL